MQRRIVEYFVDEEGDWIAVLDCGHRRHVRHQPPFIERAWVTSEQGRDAMLETPVDCRDCEHNR